MELLHLVINGINWVEAFFSFLFWVAGGTVVVPQLWNK